MKNLTGIVAGTRGVGISCERGLFTHMKGGRWKP